MCISLILLGLVCTLSWGTLQTWGRSEAAFNVGLVDPPYWRSVSLLGSPLNALGIQWTHSALAGGSVGGSANGSHLVWALENVKLQLPACLLPGYGAYLTRTWTWGAWSSALKIVAILRAASASWPLVFVSSTHQARCAAWGSYLCASLRDHCPMLPNVHCPNLVASYVANFLVVYGRR